MGAPTLEHIFYAYEKELPPVKVAVMIDGGFTPEELQQLKGASVISQTGSGKRRIHCNLHLCFILFLIHRP